MPKYWGKQIFTHGRFPEVGEKQKAYGQLHFVSHHARKPPGPISFLSIPEVGEKQKA